MRLNQTMSQSLVSNTSNVMNDVVVCDAVLARRASVLHRYLGERAFHRGPQGLHGPSLRKGKLGGRTWRPAAAGTAMPLTASPTAAVRLPGPIWATLVINRALA